MDTPRQRKTTRKIRKGPSTRQSRRDLKTHNRALSSQSALLAYQYANLAEQAAADVDVKTDIRKLYWKTMKENNYIVDLPREEVPTGSTKNHIHLAILYAKLAKTSMQISMLMAESHPVLDAVVTDMKAGRDASATLQELEDNLAQWKAESKELETAIKNDITFEDMASMLSDHGIHMPEQWNPVGGCKDTETNET